ncbi:MAG: 6-phosphofructokinase [Eubacterium sp.]|nr:6-phosphofructokinase [Eubacterium sp.]MBR7060135.1 6-phosphofructokinase [Eubacterium sp.]
MKRIAVLTSGGDAPGMNAAIRAVVRTGCENGLEVFGVVRGYSGLINGDFIPMNLRSVSDIINRGGTILYSARCPEFRTEEGMQKAIDTCKEYGIEGVVVIGGDGSFRGARDLSERGIPCVGIPGTIDNDIACCDYTIGYDTCLNTIMELVDRIRDTTESHDRCSVIEVMGRHAGYLALNSGIACGATAILIPEVPVDIQKHVIERMQRTMKADKKHFILIAAEGACVDVQQLAKEIEAKTGVESRATILGHTQRGGYPTAKDRIKATQMGYYAVKLLMQDIGNRVVACQKEQILDYDIFEALQMTKSIDRSLYDIAHEVSI